MRRLPIYYLSASVLLLTYNPLMAESFSESLGQGTADLNIRYRIETVDQDNALEDATASTIRTRLGYTTADFNNFSAHIDFEDVHRVISDDYNAIVSGDPTHSTVADPIGTELNQAYLDYKASGIKLRFGRQRIKLDNDRFIGNVGWRQNEQTYDGFSLTTPSDKNIAVTYAHLTNVNRIFFTDLNMSNDLFNVKFKGIPNSTLTTYAYLLEYDQAAASSHKTFGARYNFNINGFLLNAEYAKQSEYRDGNPRDTSYSLIEGGYTFNDRLTAKIGHETLGSNNGISFQTPLATAHAFNGWADLFLTTPGAGLKDTYASVNGKVNKFKLAAVYHSFSADAGGADYGKELDLLAGVTLKKGFSAGVKLARYDADNLAVDTNKFWLWLQYTM